jgi:hypothetical protein
MNAFAVALDTLFTDQNIGTDAAWNGNGVRVIMRRPEQVERFGSGRSILSGTILEVRYSEVANPAINDLVIFDGPPWGQETYRVIAEPIRDDLRGFWQCEAELI